MFERYTELARKSVFNARYEASGLGSPYMETEHLLLGILRADPALAARLLRPPESAESIRAQVEKRTPPREKLATSMDIPLSHETKWASD